MTTPTHIIAVTEHWLSDGSAVYDVALFAYRPRESAERVVFLATDRGAAFRLADKLAETLNDVSLSLAIVETRDHTYA